MRIVCVVLLVTSVMAEPPATAPRPVVIWHGLGDTCCHPASVGRLKVLLEKLIPGVFVLALMIGKNEKKDRHNSWHMRPWKQVTKVCKIVNGYPELNDGYNALGMSQGSQFFRALAQTCPTPRIYNLISMAGQHQGVYGIGNLKYSSITRPLTMDIKVSHWKIARRVAVPMQYWHDPTGPDQYRKDNNFIAEINNEKIFNPSFRENLLKLENLVLVKFCRDEIAIPVSTQWFEFYTPGQAEEILPLEASPLWIQDRLGLRTLSEEGKLHFIEHEEGNHLEFSDMWFEYNIVDKYLRQFVELSVMNSKKTDQNP